MQLLEQHSVIMSKETPETLDEIQLAKACIEGNERAQAQLYQIFGKQMMAVCIRYARDRDEAQDLFQDGFVKVFRKIDLYDGTGPLGAWIRRTMVNNALDQIRKNKREAKQVDAFKDEYLFNHEDQINPFQEDDNPIPDREKLMDLVAKMPHGYRTVFNMYAVEEYSHKEIADALGITESTSKTQYRKAKAYMRNLIENELNQTTRE